MAFYLLMLLALNIFLRSAEWLRTLCFASTLCNPGFAAAAVKAAQTNPDAIRLDKMDFSRLDQAKNFALFCSGKNGNRSRRNHCRNDLALRTELTPDPLALPKDNRFLDFEHYFHFLFHHMKCLVPAKKLR